MTSVKDSITNLLRTHPALIVSAFYLASSVIGMFYSWAYLRHFGINVFNYSQISDFLLASLKEPVTWVLAVVAVLLIMGDNAMSRRYGSKSHSRWTAWYGSPRYRLLNNFVAILIVFTFIYLFAAWRADDALDGEGKFVDVMFADSGAATTEMLLGTTGQFVFLYDNQTERVDIHPIENIHSISFRIPK
ncbi:MAG: hypothetical protein GTO71_10090 [Woeseiaceae bacterium]|nr:hypothetical protein [Woeseiaceae bacterium]NIP21427.1 hypothetical protein [Woeseiaceae bacterium]NIS90352.1 hypothetical protein [Woeseiaceae bacterium]